MDEELYRSVLMILVGDRNLLVSSTDPEESVDQLAYLIEQVLGLTMAVIDFSDGTEHEVRNHEIYILTNLESMNVEAQKDIVEMFETKICITVIENQDGLEMSLIDEITDKILLRCPHTPSTHMKRTHETRTVYSLSSQEAITSLREQMTTVTMTLEIKRYINDILIFIRNHRMISNGLPIFLKYEFEIVVRAVAVLNGISYVTPSIVKWSSERFFPLHLDLITDTEMEPSLNWGSDRRLVKTFINLWDRDLVVKNVLRSVKPPL